MSRVTAVTSRYKASMDLRSATNSVLRCHSEVARYPNHVSSTVAIRSAPAKIWRYRGLSFIGKAPAHGKTLPLPDVKESVKRRAAADRFFAARYKIPPDPVATRKVFA